jgi:hypothetical protein
MSNLRFGMVTKARWSLGRTPGTCDPAMDSDTYTFDADGNRVKATVSNTTTSYLGDPSVPSGQVYLEWTGSTTTMNVRSRYYYAGSTKAAMRTGSSTLNFLLGDHHSSNAITTNSSGVKNPEIRYMPCRITRNTSGTNPPTIP